jgi:small-conductance mechanosensitive channel
MNWIGVIYAVIIIVCGAGIVWFIRRKIQDIESKRKKRIKTLKDFDAVATESPLDNHTKQARRQSLQNIETRYNILRKLLLPFAFCLLLLLAILPFLETLPSTIISLLIAAVTVIISIAARPFVENLICGVVISFGKLVRIGDTVMIDDKYGTVEDITITHTTIKKWDWRRYIIPNAQMLNKAFLNYTAVDTYRWTPVKFTVSCDTDIKLVEKIAIEAIKKSSHYSSYEEPRFWVVEIEKDAVYCSIVGWADTPTDSWFLSSDTRKTLIDEFRKNNIKSHCFLHDRKTTSVK